jgi:hypothetical protein
MKKLLVALCFTCALALAVQAEEGKKQHKPMTDEQKTVMKDMVAKYDADKSGKLDKEEKAKMSAEDKAKWQKAFPRQKKKSETK